MLSAACSIAGILAASGILCMYRHGDPVLGWGKLMIDDRLFKWCEGAYCREFALPFSIRFGFFSLFGRQLCLLCSLKGLISVGCEELIGGLRTIALQSCPEES